MLPLEDRLKAEARRLGFDLVGIAPAVTPAGYSRLCAWLDDGHAGDMGYMERHRDTRGHPDSVLPNVRSVVMAAMNYYTSRSDPSLRPGLVDDATPVGRISTYAWGDDYHKLLRCRLDELFAWVKRETPGCQGRAVVDTAPLLERDFARLAGLGWFGKNTMLLNKRLGSWFFLGALLLDIELKPDPPHETSHCGTCTACLDACPTQAFPEPSVLDARRCISYLTIELRAPIPTELRAPLGDWIFGCDVCQTVCPWNRKAPSSPEPTFQPRPGLDAPALIELLHLTPEQFRARFRGTTLTRPRRSGFLRNVAIALGNSGDSRAVPALSQALSDAEPLVRGAAAWALGRLRTVEALASLRERLRHETDATVRQELTSALDG